MFFGSGDTDKVYLGVFSFATDRARNGEGVSGEHLVCGNYIDLN